MAEHVSMILAVDIYITHIYYLDRDIHFRQVTESNSSIHEASNKAHTLYILSTVTALIKVEKIDTMSYALINLSIDNFLAH